MHETGLGAMFTFPLVVPGIDLGAVGLYSTAPREMSPQQVKDATALSVILARQVLRRLVLAAEQGDADVTERDGDF